MIPKSTQNSDQAAWRTLSTLMPLVYESTTRPWLHKHPPKSSGQGLNLSCGNDVETFLIASILGDKYSLMGIEKGIRQELKPDGEFIIEIMQWSGFRAYPYNHAFVRATEILGRLGDPLPNQAQLASWLQGIGCAIIDTAYASPIFIPRNCNQIISLAMQWKQEEIMNCLGLRQEEINALLQELWQFEQLEDTLISRPGLRQIFAKKIIQL
jgi:hypothetical protein